MAGRGLSRRLHAFWSAQASAGHVASRSPRSPPEGKGPWWSDQGGRAVADENSRAPYLMPRDEVIRVCISGRPTDSPKQRGRAVTWTE